MSIPARLPAHLEVAGLIRLVETNGGIATVISKGERDAGTIAILTIQRGRNPQILERMPQLDGSRRFVVTKTQDTENEEYFSEYIEKRAQQDPDMWVLEVDIPDPERFIALLGD